MMNPCLPSKYMNSCIPVMKTSPTIHLVYGMILMYHFNSCRNLNTIRGRLRMEHFVSGIEAPETPVLNSPEKRDLIVKIRTVHGIERVKMQLVSLHIFRALAVLSNIAKVLLLL